MASGGLNPDDRGFSGLSSSTGSTTETITEQQQEIEEVVHSFMYNSLQQQQNNEAETVGEIQTPTIPDVVPRDYNPMSSTAIVGQQLAVIGDQINIQYATVFKQMIDELRITPATAYTTFREIASRLFVNGTNWGKIIALLCFGYRISAEMFRSGWRTLFPRIITFVTRYIFQEGLFNWILDHGGWITARVDDSSWFNVGAIFVLATLCVSVVVLMKSRPR